MRARVSGGLDDRSTATAIVGRRRAVRVSVCRRSRAAAAAAAAAAATRPTDDLRAWPASIQMVLVCCSATTTTTTTTTAVALPRDEIRNILGRRRRPSCLHHGRRFFYILSAARITRARARAIVFSTPAPASPFKRSPCPLKPTTKRPTVYRLHSHRRRPKVFSSLDFGHSSCTGPQPPSPPLKKSRRVISRDYVTAKCFPFSDSSRREVQHSVKARWAANAAVRIRGTPACQTSKISLCEINS
ncbi:Hypothetical protein CINCED_3A001958 [Cinara cedri]|nr:Hypothetical protein CINCED_3A001958 [Cinara cedri]